MALDFPASSASPYTAPNGVIYTWNADGYWEAKADPNDFDTDYLKLNATNGPVTGALAFEQLTTHEDGVKVTGGDSSFRQGCNFGNLQGGAGKGASLTWTRVNDSVKGSIGTGSVIDENALFIQSDTNHPLMLGTNNTPWVTIREGGTAEFAGITEHEGGVSVTGVSGNTNKGIVIQGENTVSSSAADYGVFVNPTPPAAHTGEYIGYHYRGSQIQSTQSLSVGFEAAANAADKASLNIGFRGMLPTGSNNNYNFYAEGDAPNYFAGGVQFKLAGDGAGTTDSLLLDDYEQGTFTPIFGSDNSSFTATYASGGQSGRYTKVGNVVHCEVYIQLTSTNKLGTSLRVNGLPYLARNTQNYGGGPVFVRVGFGSERWPNSGARLAPGTNQAVLEYDDGSQNTSQVRPQDLTNTSRVNFCITYTAP